MNNHESLEVIEKSVRLKLKEKLAIIEEKYGDSGNNKEDARWYYLAPMLMDGVIYAKHWIEDIVWEMNTDEEDTTSEVRSSSKDKRNNHKLDNFSWSVMLSCIFIMRLRESSYNFFKNISHFKVRDFIRMKISSVCCIFL